MERIHLNLSNLNEDTIEYLKERARKRADLTECDTEEEIDNAIEREMLHADYVFNI